MRTHTAVPGRPRPGGPGAVRRGLAAAAVAALLTVAAAACGDETGDTDPTASDASTTATSSPSASDQPSTTASPSTSTSASPTESPSPTVTGDPVPSPVITKAVKAAIRAGFPALVPAGVPAGWTVVDASYAGKGGGRWRLELTTADGAAVTLVQSAQELEAFVSATLGVEMERTGKVDLGEYGTGTWAVYTGGEVAGETTALVTSIAGTSAAVIGPDQDTLVELAELLLTAEDGGSGSGDG